MKKKLTAEQVTYRLADALLYVCIKHDINPFNEPTVEEALKAFSRFTGKKESQWQFVYEVIWNYVKETEK